MNSSSERTNRELNISCQTLGWYHTAFGGDQHAEKAFSFIRQCGFEAVDYHFEGVYTHASITEGKMSPLFDLPYDELINHYLPIKQALSRHGLSVSQAHCISPSYITDNARMNEYLCCVIVKLLQICRYLECPALVFHPNRKMSKDENIVFLKKFAPAAVENGVKICIENMFSRNASGNLPFYDAKTTCDIIDRLNDSVDQEVFGACYDVGHANVTGKSIYDDICTLGKRLVCVHIHDNDGIHDQHLIPFTQKHSIERTNTTDWAGLCNGLAEINYTGPINFEVHLALRDTPQELMGDMLRFSASVGKYFRSSIEELKHLSRNKKDCRKF